VNGRVLLGIENFSICIRKAAYASYPNWQQGFSVIYLDTESGRFQWYPVMIGRTGMCGKVDNLSHEAIFESLTRPLICAFTPLDEESS
jgi:hypothetical protein